MWSYENTFEARLLASLVYSTFYATKCSADDIPEIVWGNDDESFHIYRTELPWKPIHFNGEQNHFTYVVWVAVIAVACVVAAIVMVCCLCWKFYPKHNSRRHMSNAALVPPVSSTTIVTFQANQSVDGRIRNSTARAGDVYSRGVVNFAFTNSAPNAQLDDGPPEYSTVVSHANDKQTDTSFPPVCETKIIETPPPAYLTIAPFSDANATKQTR